MMLLDVGWVQPGGPLQEGCGQTAFAPNREQQSHRLAIERKAYRPSSGKGRIVKRIVNCTTSPKLPLKPINTLSRAVTEFLSIAAEGACCNGPEPYPLARLRLALAKEPPTTE